MWKKYLEYTLVVLGTTGLIFAFGQEAKAANLRVVAEGLDGPRGLTFGPDGALYVAEAGRGGDGNCIPSPTVEGAVLCYGPTGAITKIDNGEVERIVTGLPSIASIGSDILPDGSDASGPHDLQFGPDGTPYLVTGLGSFPGNRDDILEIPDFGQVLILNNLNDDNPSWTPLADLANYELVNNPDGQPAPMGINTNPFYMTIEEDTAFVIDAGGNSLQSVELATGNIQTEAVFPIRNVPGPTGQEIPMESVPTSVVSGPDEALYATELTGFPFPQNGARIYRLNNGTPEVFLEGFTNLMDLAFDSNGNLYVLEYATNSILSGDPEGALIRIQPNGQRTVLLEEGLINPTARSDRP